MPQNLVDFLRSTELFQDIEPVAVTELASELKPIRLQDEEVLIREGDSDDNLYLVFSGGLRVTLPSQRNRAPWFFEVGPGESVGEMAILAADPASATISASGETSLLALSRALFDRFSASHPHAALTVSEALSKRLQRHRLSMTLRRSNLFEPDDSEVLRSLESELEMLTLYGGEVLFRQGDPGDFLCIVISGRVRVVLSAGQAQETVVKELGPGELVGEMAVVSDQPRTATVHAVRDSQLAKFTKAAFDRFKIKHGGSAIEMISRKLAERLREPTATHGGRSRTVSTIGVVPSQPSAPINEFCEGLAAALSKFGPTLHLTSDRVDQHLGRPGISQTYERGGRNIRVVEWLGKQETDYDYVIYAADSTLSPWSERCIRQADHIITVADGAGDPEPGDIETELLYANDLPVARHWLALVHRQDDPSRTKRWLDVRKVERHFHVRAGEQASFDRIARLITGRALGLTLGGGFARGLAHVGVFQAFDELGVDIDVIGGASMGAMVGALRALDWERERIVRETSDACSGHFGDLTFPFIAFKSGRKFSAALRKLFGDIQIEDLWIPYFCISANLNRSELKIHTHGSLAKALLAATRAPGVFPPIVYEGELHIDGGVINNVPVDLMKVFCNDGITVGVDVSPPHELSPVTEYGDQVSGWKAFWRRCSPLSRRYAYTPSILLVMVRTLEYSGISNKNLRIKFADIYVQPDLLKFKRTDFHLVEGIAQTGYDATLKNVLKWLATPGSAAELRPDLQHAAKRVSSASSGFTSTEDSRQNGAAAPAKLTVR
jgi:lysophospholipid hydrolase